MIKVDDYIQDWLQHRLVLHEILESTKNEHIDFKPWENAYTMGSLIVHIASSMNMFVKAVKNGTFIPPTESKQYKTIDEIRNFVFHLTEENTKDLKSLNDKQLEKEIEFFNNFINTGNFWLLASKNHEIHHKGQLFTYARMVGIENLPFFVKFGK